MIFSLLARRTPVTAALAAPPHALWAEPAATLGTILGSGDTAIRRMAGLPVAGLQAVETTDGQLLFISDTGHYVVRGKAYDLWYGVAFVDPQCPHCAAFFKDLVSLADRYRFR